MDIAAIPTKIDIVWAADAGATYVRAIPDTVQQPAYPYAASWTVGFPPDTFLSPIAGGEGPDGRDMNGVLQQLSAWAQWQAAGGAIVYDSAFQTSIGGYPNRAIVGSAAMPGALWVSTTDNNTTNPDTSGAGWNDFFAPVYTKVPLNNGTGATGTWGISISGNAGTASNASQLNSQPGSFYTSYASAVASTAQSNSESYAAAVASTAQSNSESYARGLVDGFEQPQGATLYQSIVGGGVLNPSVSFSTGIGGILLMTGARNNGTQWSGDYPSAMYLNAALVVGDNTEASQSFSYSISVGPGSYTAQLSANGASDFSATINITFLPSRPSY